MIDPVKTSPQHQEQAPLRILHIIPTADPRYGGPVEGIIKSSAALARLGHFRELVTLDHPSDVWLKEFPIPVFPLGVLPSDARKRWRWLPWVHYGYTPKLIPWLRANTSQYDIVIVNGLWNYSTFAASRSLIQGSSPYYVFTHGMLDPWFRKTYPVKSLLKQAFWWFCEGPLLARSQGVLFTCEEEKLLARNAFWPYRAKEFVVGYGTSDVEGDRSTQIEKFRNRVPSLQGRQYLLFLSRIHPKKGCDLLIQAFAKIASSNPELDLVIAGPDQTGWTSQLRNQAARAGIGERIHWPGMLEGDEKWGAFHGCDAFVLPSHQENFGIVVAEALACGKPVLITDKVNIWREIQKEGGGIVAVDTIDGISDLLKKFQGLTTEERSRMGSAARGTFLKNFDINKNVVSLLEVFRLGSRL